MQHLWAGSFYVSRGDPYSTTEIYTKILRIVFLVSLHFGGWLDLVNFICNVNIFISLSVFDGYL